MTTLVARYTKTAIWLHWIVAILMLYMLFFGEDLIRVPEGGSLGGWQPTAHASWGVMVLLFAVARLLWRLTHPAPPLPATTPDWQARISHVTHWALYALMIAIPIFGLFALIPYGTTHTDVDQVVFFRLFSLAFMPNIGDWTMAAHGILGNIAKVLIILHVAAALKHQFWDKDGLLSRMRPM